VVVGTVEGGLSMRVLITGVGGQVGRATAEVCAAAGDDVIGTDRAALDITDRDAVLTAITGVRPDAVINPAAYTDVDGCERDPDRAYGANTLAVRHLAEGCRQTGGHLVHVSTDYVFDGRKGSPYVEWDETGPLGTYARSKLAGELEAGPESTVVRTSWVFSRFGGNFVQAVLDRAAAGEPLRFIDDQIGTPTSAHDVAHTLRHLAVSRAPGLFHATNSGQTTRFAQAQQVLAAAGLDPEEVERITSAELQWVAPRPANTVLDNAALRLSGVPALRHYTEALDALVKELTQ
jgi:dTDP-4-dehydrorhamnose reductase